MASRRAQALLASSRAQLVPSTSSRAAASSSRAFATTAPAEKARVYSALHKVTLERKRRAELGQGAHADRSKIRLPLDEAAKVLQVRPHRYILTSRLTRADRVLWDAQAWTPLQPNLSYDINVQVKPTGTIQLNAIRGRAFLPHSCANSTKHEVIVVFASGKQAEAARQAGADIVGGQELVDDILLGKISPDKLITTNELLPLFQRNPTLARTLGPRGLMPSVKRGTVTEDVVQAIQEARGGLDWKGDSRGVVRAGASALFLALDTSIADRDRNRSHRPPALQPGPIGGERAHAARLGLGRGYRWNWIEQGRVCAAAEATCVSFHHASEATR